jgi:hypothetical protein
MRRRYRLLTFKKDQRQYLSLVVEYQDKYGAWHSKVIKSYGQSSPVALSQGQSDLNELERLASEATNPIPVGTIDEVIWANFYQTLRNPLEMWPFIPLGIARDLSHLAAAVISSISGNLQGQIDATQPSMEPSERQQFLGWLQQHSQDDQRIILAYQWKYKL